METSSASINTVRARAGAIFRVTSGNFLEQFDFFLFGFYATYIAHTFFPASSEFASLMMTFAVFGAGFLMRPIGAVVLGAYIDKVGRRKGLIVTLSIMATGTFLIVLIPSYAAIGYWAPLIVLMGRLLQGFSAGAELGGVSVYLSEIATPGKKGFYTSWQSGSQQVAIMVAAAMGFALNALMEESAIRDWGWRIPFLSSVLIALAALWIRRHLRETPVFERRKQELEAERAATRDAQPVADARGFWTRTRAFWTLVGLRIGENGPSYLAQGFMVGYVAKVLMVDKSVPTTAVFIASVLGFAVIPLAGWLSDRFGRRITYRGFCLLLMFYAWPAFYLLDSREPAIVIPVIVVGMALASLGIYGVQAAWGVELFGVKHRYTKMAVAKELGSILSGGTAPLLAAAMLSWSGHWWPIAVYFSAMAAIGFFTTFVAPETRGRDLNLPEDAI